jgi:excisionase family DNA binding protein
VQEEFLTVAEVAARLKLNQQTIRNWIDRGELGAIRIGARRVRIPESELGRFITESSTAGRPTQAEAREAFSRALEAVEASDNPEELIPALRRLSRASATLARSLSEG